MTDNPETPRDPLYRLLMQMLSEDKATAKIKDRNAHNLSEQIIQLCNEFLDAGKNATPQHTRGDVTISLIRALGSTLAQMNESDPAGLWTQYDAACKLLREECLIAFVALHSLKHKLTEPKQ